MAIVAQQTIAVNVPVILTSAGTAIASNTARTGWSIVNLGTNPLYVLMQPPGTTTLASTTVFHTPLKASSVADDGSGGSVGQEQGVIFTGNISVAGTSPRYVVVEFAA